MVKDRVKIRVQEGGHDIPKEVIERRYRRGIYNLFDIYLPLVDGALLFDNSYGKHELIAQTINKANITVFDKNKFQKLKDFYDHKR